MLELSEFRCLIWTANSRAKFHKDIRTKGPQFIETSTQTTASGGWIGQHRFRGKSAAAGHQKALQAGRFMYDYPPTHALASALQDRFQNHPGFETSWGQSSHTFRSSRHYRQLLGALRSLFDGLSLATIWALSTTIGDRGRPKSQTHKRKLST